jgi:serine/threonine protein kinase
VTVDVTQVTSGSLLKSRYRIDAFLAEGGMGYVYRGTTLSSGEKVAIKQTFFPEEDRRHWFENEAETLKKLDHSALPKVIDYFSEEGQGYFLVMKFIPGVSLMDLVSNIGAVPSSLVVPWAIQALEATNYLHTQVPYVLHRDIKPHNIKIHKGKVFLLDFGLAKTGDSTIVPGVSKHYSSPEQVRGLHTDVRSDLYSVGATLYYLLTSIVPLDAYYERYRAVELKKLDPLKDVSHILSSVPEPLSLLIHRAMALNPEDRFQSAHQMLEALRSVPLTTPIPQITGTPGTTAFEEASQSSLQKLLGRSIPPPRPPVWLTGGQARVVKVVGSQRTNEEEITPEEREARKRGRDIWQVAKIENQTDQNVAFRVLNEDNSWTEESLTPQGYFASSLILWRKNMNVIVAVAESKEGMNRYSLATQAVIERLPTESDGDIAPRNFFAIRNEEVGLYHQPQKEREPRW